MVVLPASYIVADKALSVVKGGDRMGRLSDNPAQTNLEHASKRLGDHMTANTWHMNQMLHYVSVWHLPVGCKLQNCLGKEVGTDKCCMQKRRAAMAAAMVLKLTCLCKLHRLTGDTGC